MFEFVLHLLSHATPKGRVGQLVYMLSFNKFTSTMCLICCLCWTCISLSFGAKHHACHHAVIQVLTYLPVHVCGLVTQVTCDFRRM